jgi:hypothetical protein
VNMSAIPNSPVSRIPFGHNYGRLWHVYQIIVHSNS